MTIKRIILSLTAVLCMTVNAQDNNALTIHYGTFNIRYINGDRKTAHEWKYRRDSVVAVVASNELNICGMQEVLHEQLKDLKKLLPKYTFVGVGRENGRKKGEYSPICFRTKEWKVVKSGTFWLSETPDKVSRGWDAALERIATWALLKHRETGKQVMAINTHFDHRGRQARVESGRLILRKAKELAAGVPLVLTGDFNVGMQSDVYESITHDSEFPIADSFTVGAPHEGVGYTYHNFGKLPEEQRDKIDFIFISPSIRVLNTAIPHSDNTSDHNPIIATLLIP